MQDEVFGFPVELGPWRHQGALPLYIENAYSFSTADIADTRCTIARPADDLPTLPALKRQLEKIRKAGNAPVVLELGQLSPRRRQGLIKNNIAFVTDKQAFLPFIGAMLSDERKAAVKRDAFYFSTQELFLLYLRGGKRRFYAKEALEVLPFSAMTLSRAVKQLGATGFFNISKDGVSNVIESKFERLELFAKAQEFLSSPVRASGYIDKNETTAGMALAAESALAEKTMLDAGKTKTLAIYEKNFDRACLAGDLVDPDKQVKLELWAYEPTRFSGDACADPLSVALSFKNIKDERIEQAVEEMVGKELDGQWLAD